MFDLPLMMPSEVARLIYGYFVRECPTAAKKFLDTHPHLEECREYVAKTGKTNFPTDAFGMSLEEILGIYCDITDILFSQMSSIIPDLKNKFSNNPVEAVKFLLSLSAPKVSAYDLDDFLDYQKNKTSDSEASSNICLQIGFSPDNNEKGSSLADDENCQEIPNSQSPNIIPSLKMVTRNRYLDELYASTESLNPNPKKKLKMLKPWIQSYIKSNKQNNYNRNRERNLMEGKFSDDELSNMFVATENNETLSYPNPLAICKSTCTKNDLTPVENKPASVELGVINKKQLKIKGRSVSPLSELQVTGKKLGKSVNAIRENDSQLNFTKIPQMLIENPRWSELIAENINKEISESLDKPMHTSTGSKNVVIENIAERTLDTNLCEEFIRELLSITGDENHGAILMNNDELMNQNHYNITEVGPSVGINDDSDNIRIDQTVFLNNENSDNINVNDLIQFKKNSLTNFSGNSDVIVINLPEHVQQNITTIGEYFVNSDQTKMVSSDLFVDCNSPELKSDIEQGNNVQRVTRSTEKKINSLANSSIILSHCTSITPLSKTSTRHRYRAIAPKKKILEEPTYIQKKNSSRKSNVSKIATPTKTLQRGRR